MAPKKGCVRADRGKPHQAPAVISTTLLIALLFVLLLVLIITSIAWFMLGP